MTTSYLAYTVYTYAVGSGVGMAGTITDTGSAITPLPNLELGLNGDPQVEGFVQPSGTALRAAVTKYTGSGGPGVNIYDAVTRTRLTTPAKVWSNVTNLYGLVPNGGYLYALDFDDAQVVEINPSTFTETGVRYSFSSSGLIPSGYVAHGQALIDIGGVLYGLFTIVNSAWTTYSASILVKFTISGGTSIAVGASDYNNGLEKNAFALAVNGADLYVASMGGAQGSGTYNAASKLQKLPWGAANLSTAAVTLVMSPSATYPYEFRDITFKSGTAYILMGAYNGSWQMTGKLLATSNFTTFTVINDFSAGVAGYFWSAQYTPDNDRIWMARGNAILAYTAASPATPAATLTIASGSLKSANQPFDSLNDLSYVGAAGSLLKFRGYRSPVQVSHSPRGQQARAIAQGRPELTDEELQQLEAALT